MLYIFIALGAGCYLLAGLLVVWQEHRNYLQQASFREIAWDAYRLLYEGERSIPLLKRLLYHVEKNWPQDSLLQAACCRTIILCCLKTLHEGESDYTNQAMQEALITLGARR